MFNPTKIGLFWRLERMGGGGGGGGMMPPLQVLAIDSAIGAEIGTLVFGFKRCVILWNKKAWLCAVRSSHIKIVQEGYDAPPPPVC